MSVQADGDTRLTWEEFLRFQQAYDGPERFVWDEGRVVQVMTGGTERHDLVVMALVRQLDTLFPGRPCYVFAHNRQIKTAQRSYYPDVLVRCGRAADPLYETDARLVIDVIPPSNSPAERNRHHPREDRRRLGGGRAALRHDRGSRDRSGPHVVRRG